MAEETSLIETLGNWVFDMVCIQIQQWKSRKAQPVRVAVNVSARQFRTPGFVEAIQRKLMACGPLDGFGIDLEITETALQTESGIVGALEELKAFGFTIAIDDFGTGYSSLSSLKHLPVNVLKIDRSFIRDIPADPDCTAIASAIIAMGHSLGLSIVAEGIETQEQLRFVSEHGCDEAQGFLFFGPLTAQECESLLVDDRAASVLPPARNPGRLRPQAH